MDGNTEFKNHDFQNFRQIDELLNISISRKNENWYTTKYLFSNPKVLANKLLNFGSPNAQQCFRSQRWRKWRKSPKSANTSKLAKLQKMPNFHSWIFAILPILWYLHYWGWKNSIKCIFSIIGLLRQQNRHNSIISNSTYHQMIIVGPNGIWRNFTSNGATSYAGNWDLTTERQIGMVLTYFNRMTITLSMSTITQPEKCSNDTICNKENRSYRIEIIRFGVNLIGIPNGGGGVYSFKNGNFNALMSVSHHFWRQLSFLWQRWTCQNSS